MTGTTTPPSSAGKIPPYDVIKKQLYAEWIGPAMNLWNVWASTIRNQMTALHNASPKQKVIIAREINASADKLIADNEPLRVDYLNKMTQAWILESAQQSGHDVAAVRALMLDAVKSKATKSKVKTSKKPAAKRTRSND